MKRISLMILAFTFILGCSISPSEKEMDTLQEINLKLDIITSSPKEFSNPYKYIEVHKTEFDYLVAKKQITLNHFINEFEITNKDGLKEYIMAMICVKILGDENPVQEWESGREWYDLYMKSRKNS